MSGWRGLCGNELRAGTEARNCVADSVELRSSDQLPSSYMANNHVGELVNKTLPSSPMKPPEEIPAIVNIFIIVL